jgi:integrase/recombinase XerC
MNETNLTTQSGLTPALQNAISMWADCRTDATSRRRADLVRDKVNAVTDFFAWVGKPPAQVTPIDIKVWQSELEGQGLAHSTVYGRVSRLSSFYKWALADSQLAETIHHNPVDLARPKPPKAYANGSCKSLDDDEIKALLGVVKGKASFNDIVGMRDLALVLLFLSTALRRAEIVNLRWGDIRLNGRLTISTTIKGGDVVRQDVTHPKVVDALVSYLRASGRWGHLQADDPIWTRHDRAGEPGAPLTARAFAANLRRYGKKVGIDDLHPHQLRHTAARLLEEETGSIGAVQELLNHRHQATTRLYLGAVRVKRDRYSGAILDRLEG